MIQENILQACIFHGRILNMNIIRIELIDICTENLPKRFVHEGSWEVLDEGVGGSLTTHLQEVLPATRGEQILTSKETPGTYAHLRKV